MLKQFIRSIAIAGFFAMGAAPALAAPPEAYIEFRIGSTRPPPVRREVRVAAPDRGHVWVPGFWDWQGDWVWIPGHWEPTQRNVYWVRPRYVPEYGQWRYVPGHWSNQQVREGDTYRQWRDEHRHKQRGNNGKHNGHHKGPHHK